MRKVIPLKDVTGVRKAKTAIVVPNAVEITVFGKREFFTSFLSPDKAYRMILEAWKNTSRYAKLFLGKPLSEGETEEPSRPLSAPIRRRSRSKKDLLESSWDADDSPKSSDAAYDPHTLAPDASPTPGSPPSESAHRNSSDIAGSPPHAQAESGASTGRNSHDTSRAPPSGKDTPADKPSLQDLEEGTSVLQSRIPDLQVFVETELNVTTLEFFSIFWKDSSAFFQEFLESSDNACKSVNILPWTDHRHVGHARDVTFEAPVKASFGPKSTHCHQTQAYRLSASGNHLIIETSQVMSDIPYSDYFRVEMRWEVRNAKEGNKCNLTVAMDVPFSKKTVWKSLIEASARDECHKQYHGWVTRAQDEIKEYRAKTPFPLDASMPPVALAPPATALPDANAQELPDVISNMLRSQSELKKQESLSGATSSPERPAPVGSFAGLANETPAKNTASSRSDRPPQHGDSMLRTPGWSMLARNAVLCLLAVGCAGLLWWIWSEWSSSEGMSLHPSALPRGWKPGALCLEGECSAKFWERRISYLTQDLGMLERRISLIHEELAMAQQNVRELQERENYNNEGCRNVEEGGI
ncbi:GRAM domain-containing protein, variant 3 [Cymbomonas tetramitiformis]|uniref:GRAM domain-containing protein, variant 3 n=1 Tax=Cymbomonas tetramitiformis TaxID=36881 RepID=A0AAE0GYJ6_9CHLO|nr:GRAM domain-containing protein, variant 3 [Cymbomonas tetramitiformis]